MIMKIKKYFLKIMASFVASASLILVAVAPAQAEKGETLCKIFSMNIGGVNNWLNSEPALVSNKVAPNIRGILKQCQENMVKNINAAVNKEWGSDPSDIKFGKHYRLSKDRYRHIIYGDYSRGIHCGGLHSEKGLDVLKSAFQKFKREINKYLEARNKQSKNNAKYNVQFLKAAAKLSIKKEGMEKSTNAPIQSLKKWLDNEKSCGYSKFSDSLKKYALKFSDAEYKERYLFPKDWGFNDFKKALNSAVQERIKNGDKGMVSSCDIKDPVNSEQTIKVKLVVEDSGRIKSFYPDDGVCHEDEVKSGNDGGHETNLASDENSESKLKNIKKSEPKSKNVKKSKLKPKNVKDIEPKPENVKNSESKLKNIKNSEVKSTNVKDTEPRLEDVESSKDKSANAQKVASAQANLKVSVPNSSNVQMFACCPVNGQWCVFSPFNGQWRGINPSTGQQCGFCLVNFKATALNSVNSNMFAYYPVIGQLNGFNQLNAQMFLNGQIANSNSPQG